MKKFIGMLFFLIISYNLPTCTFAKSQVNRPVLCNQLYALCSATKCIPDPRHAGYALCQCDVYKGISAGFLSCQQRTPLKNKDKTQRIISTFSFENKNKPAMACPSGTLWTNCVDAPCTVDPEDPKKAICSCLVKKKSAIVTFGGNCKTNTCSTSFWSGATAKQSVILRNGLRQAVKSTDQDVKQCQ